METDWVVGQIQAAVDKNQITKDTLIVFSTDNGCSRTAFSHGGVKEPQVPGDHRPSHVYHGYKTSAYEGGHRVPFILSWPGTITAGSK